MHVPSTLKPAEVAVAMVEAGVAKHRTRLDMIFFKAVCVLSRVPPAVGGVQRAHQRV